MTDIAVLFATAAQECRNLGSPFTGRVLDRVLDLLDPESPLGRRILLADAGPEEAFPLRLAGALHGLARAGDPDLAAVYPPHEVSDTALGLALRHALTRRAADILPWLDQPPQTNEVARSAVLIAAGHWLTARFGLPLVLTELGASAGVNLWWDHYGLRTRDRVWGPADPALTLTPDWRGTLPPLATPRIVDRAGADLFPLDPVADRDRLLAYIWADQTARAARCVAALDLTAAKGLRVTRSDAADFAVRRLAGNAERRRAHRTHRRVPRPEPNCDTAGQTHSVMTAVTVWRQASRPRQRSCGRTR